MPALLLFVAVASPSNMANSRTLTFDNVPNGKRTFSNAAAPYRGKKYNLTLKGPGCVYMEYVKICTNPPQVLESYFYLVYDIDSIFSTTYKKNENKVICDKG